MDLKYVIYQKNQDRRTATIILNRPEKLNAINQGMKLDFLKALDDVERDESTKVVVIKGAGGSFSSGADLSSAFTDPETSWGVKIKKAGEAGERASLRRMLTTDRWLELEFPSAIAYCSKATVAQLHGHVLGLAFDLAMQCDLIIASEESIIGNPMTRAMGPYYDGSAFSWDLQFGIGLAKEHCFAPRLFDGKEACRLGIVNRVVPLAHLDEEVSRYVQGICHMPGDGIATGKGMQAGFLDIMGYRKGFNSGYLGHGVHGNMRWEEGEFVFFSQRAKKGARGFFTERDERTRGIWDNDARFTRVKTREQRAQRGAEASEQGGPAGGTEAV